MADIGTATGTWKRELSNEEFAELGGLVQGITGIRLPSAKRVMMEARLQKRLRALGLASFSEYCAYLENDEEGENEIIELVNAMTTNKTDFFREADHFEVLFKRILPHALKRRSQKPYRVWSASCSTGEEPYTLAIVLAEFAAEHPGFEFEIVATDVSTRVLGVAREAIYRAEQVAPIPEHLLGRHFLRHRNAEAGLYKVAPELRARVKFDHVNLIHDDFGRFGMFDAVFCRNTLMYFGPQMSENVLRRLCNQVVHGGHIFLGHAEMRTEGGLPMRHFGPAVYERS